MPPDDLFVIGRNIYRAAWRRCIALGVPFFTIAALGAR
jgi:hypothetical protein